jgi:hypothetical protein
MRVFVLSASVTPDVLNAFALNELRPFFRVVVVHVTVVFADLHTMFLRVAPRTYKRYFVAPEYLRNVTFAVRPLNVHFTERNEGVTTTTGVAGAATGTVTTGDSTGLASDPPEPSTVVDVDSSDGNEGTSIASD